MKKILYHILALLIIFMLILIYGRFFGVNGLKTNEYIIKSNSIDEYYNGLKIIHFSDLHYKKVITEKRVKDLIKEINKQKPDIVIFTGDLLDKDYKLNTDDISFLIKELSKIETTYGCYSIIGDNDYLKEDEIKNIYLQSNFTLLDNDYSIIKNPNNKSIIISGISSYTYDEADTTKIDEYLNNNNNDSYKIILMHEPDYIEKLNYNYDLALAGHSLNGSVNIPFIKKLFLEDNAKDYYKPYYKVNNTDFYISNGIGVSNINFRVFNTPSINIYRILKG